MKSDGSQHKISTVVISYGGKAKLAIADRLGAIVHFANKAGGEVTPTERGIHIRFPAKPPTNGTASKTRKSKRRNVFFQWAAVEYRGKEELGAPDFLSLLLCRELNHVERYWAAQRLLDCSWFSHESLPEHWRSIGTHAVLRAADEDWRSRSGFYELRGGKIPHQRWKRTKKPIDITQNTHWVTVWGQFMIRVAEILREECLQIADPLDRWQPREGGGRPHGGRTYEPGELEQLVSNAIGTVARRKGKRSSQVTQNEVAEELDIADDRALRYHLHMSNVKWKDLKQLPDE